MVVRELIAELGLDFIGEGFEKAHEAFESLEHKAGAAFGVIGAGILALTALTIETGEHAEKVKLLSTELGIGAEQFQELAYAASMTNVGMDEFGNSLKFLQKNLAGAAAGGAEQSQEFTKLGISVRDAATGKIRPANDVFLQLADKIKGMKDPSERVRVAMGLMGRAGAQMIPSLMKGSEGFRELAKEADESGMVMSDEALEGYEKLNEGIKRLKGQAQGFFYQLAERFLPILTRIIVGVSEWYKAHQKIISAIGTNVVQLFANSLQLVVDVVTTAYKGFSQFIELLGPAGPIFETVAVAALAMWAALTFPVAGIMVLAAAIMLLVDDFEVFIHGGKSATGAALDFIGSLFGIDEAGKKVRESLGTLFTGEFMDKHFDFFRNMVDDIEDAGKAIMGLIEGIQNLLNAIPGVMPILKVLTNPVGAAIDVASGETSLFSKVGNAVSSAFGGGAPPAPDSSGQMSTAADGGPMTSGGANFSQAPAAAPVSMSHQQTNNITINGANMSKEELTSAVKTALDDHQADQYQAAYSAMTNGVP